VKKSSVDGSRRKLIGANAKKRSGKEFASAKLIRHENDCVGSKRKLIGADAKKRSGKELDSAGAANGGNGGNRVKDCQAIHI